MSNENRLRLPPTSETAEAIAFVLEGVASELRKPPSPKWAEVLGEALKHVRDCEEVLADCVAQLGSPSRGDEGGAS